MKNTIYTKDYCPYCRAAKKALKNRDIEFNEIDVEFDLAMRQEMVSRSGRTTVPQIFFEEQHIGGYDDLMAFLSPRHAA